MGLKAVQLLQHTKKLYQSADDIVGLGVRKLTKPQNIDGLHFAPEAIGDTIKISKTAFKIPSADKLKLLLKEQGMVDDFITDNNSLFLEDLLKRFPIKQGENSNKVVQDLMTCLEDINHASFTDKAKFLDDFIAEFNKIDDAFSDIFTKNGVELFSKRAILEAKYNNPKRYQEIMDLLALHKQGKAPKYVLATLFPKSSFHALPKSDMQKLLRGEHYYPQLTSLSDDIIPKLEIGEAFSVGKEMFVKTTKGYEKLKIDAQTYERLFPPIERYALAQGSMGNCHLMATMDSIIKNPEGRIEFYKMFEQVENGVKCTIPAYKNSGIIYKFDDLSMLNGKHNMKGSLGHKMIEYTYSKNNFDDLVKLANNGNYGSEFYLETHKTPIEYFNRSGDYDDIQVYIKDFLGKEATMFYPEKLPKLDLHRKPSVVNVNGFKDEPRIGLMNAHYYNADLATKTIINPWNTMEEIFHNPFKLSEIVT